MEKAWFMAPMEYRIDGKDIMNPMDYTSLFFEVLIMVIMVKD